MVIGAMALAATLGSPAFADEFSGFRLGVGLSQDTFESDVDYFGYFDNVDTDRAGYQVFGGWALNKYFGVEAGYRDGGNFNQQIMSNGFFPTARVKMHQEVKAFETSVTGAWWITDKFSLFGRAGLFMWKGEVTFSEEPNITDTDNTVFIDTYDDDGFEPIIGVGIQTQLDGALVRLEYQMAELDDFGDLGTDPHMLDQKLNSLQFSIVWVLR
jgi:OOP family OmpA-OmpF porin/outer membrane immunogenic protein